jgi:hypothetical protein
VTDRTASIDDLLGYEDDTPPPAPRRAGAATVVKTVLVAVGLTAAIVLGLRPAGIAVPIALVGLGVCAVIAVRQSVRMVAAPSGVTPRRAIDPYEAGDAAYHWPTPDAMRRAVARWEQRLTWHGDTPGTFDMHVQPALRELVDERLRLRHGVTIAGDPARARRLLGEQLWELLTGQHRRGPGQRELAEALTRLEDLS